MWIGGHQRFEFAHQFRVAAERKVGINPFHQRDQTQLFQPPDLRLQGIKRCQIGQRRSAPQTQRIAQPCRRGVWLIGGA
jgi:hypothetical protein